jgi:hypothetical protein
MEPADASCRAEAWYLLIIPVIFPINGNLIMPISLSQVAIFVVLHAFSKSEIVRSE